MQTDLFRTTWRCAVLVLLAASPLPAVEVRPPLENKITQALKTKRAVNFENVPLSEVLKELTAAADVPYFVDHQSLAENGVKLDVVVTLKRGEQTMASTLREVLDPLGLDYHPEPEWLYVTAGTSQCEWLETRFFDVSRLVSLIEPRLILYRAPHAQKQPWGKGRGGFAGGHFGQAQFGGVGGGVIVDSPKEKPSADSVDAKATRRMRIIEEYDSRFPAETCLIAFLIANTSGQWEEIDGVGGAATAGSGRLVVRQTPRVQREAFQALSDLETMLSNPPATKRMRLGDSEEDREERAKLDQLLDAPTNVAPGMMSLKKFIEEEFVTQGLRFAIDEEGFKDEGLNWDELQITIVAGVTRRTLLEEAFRPHFLRILYEDDRFKVVCLAKADEVLATFLYDLSDIPEARDREWLARVLMDDTSGQWEDVDGVGGTLDLPGTDDLQIGGLLIVRQTEKVHEEIPAILDTLRSPSAVPTKVADPARTRSVYPLSDVTAATDLQQRLPELVVAPGVKWGEDSVIRVGSTLIVTQTEAVHHRIERIVGALNRAHNIDVEVPVNAKAADKIQAPPAKE